MKFGNRTAWGSFHRSLRTGNLPAGNANAVIIGQDLLGDDFLCLTGQSQFQTLFDRKTITGSLKKFWVMPTENGRKAR
jgi:hypothetical protein